MEAIKRIEHLRDISEDDILEYFENADEKTQRWIKRTYTKLKKENKTTAFLRFRKEFAFRCMPELVRKPSLDDKFKRIYSEQHGN